MPTNIQSTPIGLTHREFGNKNSFSTLKLIQNGGLLLSDAKVGPSAHFLICKKSSAHWYTVGHCEKYIKYRGSKPSLCDFV